MTKKPNPFMTKRSIDELERLPEKEQELILGIAKLATWTHQAPDTARESIQKFYPSMNPDLKEKVSIALEYLLEIIEPIKAK